MDARKEPNTASPCEHVNLCCRYFPTVNIIIAFGGALLCLSQSLNADASVELILFLLEQKFYFSLNHKVFGT